MNRLSTEKLQDIVGRLPTSRDEDWKYTDLKTARDISTRWLAAGSAAALLDLDEEIQRITGGIDAHWFVIANGVLQRLTEAADVAAERIDGPPGTESALAELNAALLQDGLRIRIDGVAAKPVGVLVIDGAADPSVAQAYVEIELAAGASADIVEYHASQGTAELYSNTALTLAVGDNASVNYVRLQNRAPGHVQTGRMAVTMGRDSRLRMASYDLGGGLIRNDVVIDLSQPGADVAFDGLYLAGDGQHIDNHTRVDHRVGPAISTQEYRGILNGRCRCVWNGKAVVHEGADGTDASQANHNLLLSEKAEIDAKPELEIYAEDVKCSHGTTVGQLDESSIFYLRTRGIGEEHARQMLTFAFAADIVARAPVDAARAAVSACVEKRLAELIAVDFIPDLIK